MICLTGDIHHTSLITNDQKYIAHGDSEIKISVRFLKFMEKYGLKVTFYVTGKSFTEEWEDIKPIAASELVEIGGHTYGGLPLGKISQLRYKIVGRTPPSHASTYGSYFTQKRDILKMIDAVKSRTGKEIVSWRSHGYVHNKHTYTLLARMGICYVSDEISATKILPEKTKEGLISHPINCIPDHDHLYHAHRNEEFVRKAKIAGYGADDFGSGSYCIEEWVDMVQKQIIEIENKGGLSTVLIHPVCMYLADKFKMVDKLLRFIAQNKAIWVKEIKN